MKAQHISAAEVERMLTDTNDQFAKLLTNTQLPTLQLVSIVLKINNNIALLSSIATSNLKHMVDSKKLPQSEVTTLLEDFVINVNSRAQATYDDISDILRRCNERPPA